jgi:small subunit ribosomal protein S30
LPFTGFNVEVLKTLLKFYLNEPKERAGVDMTPYLNKSAPTLSKIENQEQRIFQEKLFKNIFANRDKHQPDPEYWDWEWIYKINNKMRPQEARRRPFELWQDPWQKTFYERLPRYVPKALRENVKDERQKYEKPYYP